MVQPGSARHEESMWTLPHLLHTSVSACQVLHASMRTHAMSVDRFVPGCPSLIVIENLKYQGYKTISPCSKLSLSTLSSCLSSLASVHAAGLILKQKTPSMSSSYPCFMETELFVGWRVDMFRQGLQVVQGKMEGGHVHAGVTGGLR